MTKGPTRKNGNVAILTIARTEKAEKTIKEINNSGKWGANKIGNKTNLEHNKTNTNTYKRKCQGRKYQFLQSKRRNTMLCMWV